MNDKFEGRTEDWWVRYRSRGRRPVIVGDYRIQRLIADYKNGNLLPAIIFGLKYYYYQIKPQKKKIIPAEERPRYLNELRANLPAIQRLIIDSNNCITDMCFIGGKYASDKSPLIMGHHAYTPIYNLLFAQMKNRP